MGAPGGGYWRAPGGDAFGVLDLRPIPDMSLMGGSPQGFGLFVYPTARVNPSLVAYLGDSLDVNLTPQLKDALDNGLGVALSNTVLVDVLWELFNVWADATGATRWKPLIPQTDGRLVLHLGGFSPIRDDAYSHARYPLVQQVVKVDWEKLEGECAEAKSVLDVEGLTWEQAQARFAGLRALKRTDPNVMQSTEWGRLHRLAALPEPEHHRRVLQALCEKYRLSANEFEGVWGRSLPPPLPHATTINENWNCADSVSLNCQLTWTEVNGNFDIVTNQAVDQTDTGTNNIARADTNLASADHYSQALVNRSGTSSGSRPGVILRKDATATETYYFCSSNNTGTNSDRQEEFWKVVAGVATRLAFTAADGAPLPVTNKTQINGSSWEVFIGGVSRLSGTDTAITGNLRCGIYGTFISPSSKPSADDFKAADLAAARNLERLERHYPRGHMRGVLRGVL